MFQQITYMKNLVNLLQLFSINVVSMFKNNKNFH